MSAIRKMTRPKMCVPEPAASAVPADPALADVVANVEANVEANVVANVVAPVRRKRPTKVAVPQAPKEPEAPKESKEPSEPKETKAKAMKAPKEPKAPKKVTKKAKEADIPLLHKEVTLPTHQEMDMEEYSAEGFHIEYVSLSVFTHEDNTYFRDKRKNKLYQYGGPRRVGPYIGRYHPGREEIFTDLPDSDAE